MTEPTVQEIEARFRKEYEEKYAIWKAKDLADLEEKQNQTIQEEIQKLGKKIQEEQKPLTVEQIQKLVNQEYATISIKLMTDGNNEEEFVIRELPQSLERKFYKQFRERLRNKGSELAAFTQRNQDEPFEKMLMSFLDTFDGGFDVLSDAVTIIINPFGKREDITPEWVANHVSSNRMYSIILAQVEVNKLRDFFSRVFQSGQKVETMLTPPNIQQLRQLVR